jgi:hypothetical protein
LSARKVLKSKNPGIYKTDLVTSLVTIALVQFKTLVQQRFYFWSSRGVHPEKFSAG